MYEGATIEDNGFIIRRYFNYVIIRLCIPYFVFEGNDTSKNKRVIDIGQMSTALGPQRSRALPFWVALTGCDSISSIRGRSKRTAFNIWKKSSPSLTETMIELTENPFSRIDVETTQFKALESYAILLYGSGADTLNGLRNEIFCHRNQNPEMLPPTQDAFVQHFRRAVYQAGIWACANIAEINPPDPCDYGWKNHNNRLQPLWISIAEVRSACQELVKCSCKNVCATACGCRKKSLTCTSL